MSRPSDAADVLPWEKEFAPKISRGYLTFVAVLYGLWILFLSGIAVNRWFIGSQ